MIKPNGIPGERTLENLLRTAMMPMGHTLYIYGGGWNWQDTGASDLTKRIGLSESWRRFFEQQDMTYTYRNDADKKNSYYPYGTYNGYSDLGLDCSGYIGWTLYNTIHAENGHDGLVMSSTKMAKNLAERGWGHWTQNREQLHPGDIISKNGHVWMCIGVCADGSVVIAHSTPSDSREGYPGGGVQLSALGKDKNCEAYVLADHYMKNCFQEWYERYSVAIRDYENYMHFEGEETGVFSWNVMDNNGVLKDSDGIQKMSVKDVLKLIFEN